MARYEFGGQKDSPVSVTLKKNVSVMPSVKVRATRNSENGGRWRASFTAANVTDNMM
jgi:hypothetical protein